MSAIAVPGKNRGHDPLLQVHLLMSEWIPFPATHQPAQQ